MLTVPSVTPDAISELSAREMRRAVVRRWFFRFRLDRLYRVHRRLPMVTLSRVVLQTPGSSRSPHLVGPRRVVDLITERGLHTNHMQASC